MRVPEGDLLDGLVEDGLLRREGASYRTTRRWQTTMARAALRLLQTGRDDDDLRVPVTAALVEIYGEHIPDERIVQLVEVLLPIEAAELDPRTHLARRSSPPA